MNTAERNEHQCLDYANQSSRDPCSIEFSESGLLLRGFMDSINLADFGRPVVNRDTMWQGEAMAVGEERNSTFPLKLAKVEPH